MILGGRTMECNHIQLTYKDKLAKIELDAPPANTLSTTMIQELRTVFKQLRETDHVHAIIITGSGKFFAAGADIKEFVPAMGDAHKGRSISEAGQALCNEIESMNKPVIAAINGPALGGGLELAMACHFRIAAHDAKLGLPELNLGLIPSFGGTQRLARITGIATATELILSSKHINGEQAFAYGIVQLSTPQEELLPTTLATANGFINGHSMTSVIKAMESIVYGYHESFADGLKRERENFAALFQTEDAKEGVNAFVEKRKPSFKHK